MARAMALMPVDFSGNSGQFDSIDCAEFADESKSERAGGQSCIVSPSMVRRFAHPFISNRKLVSAVITASAAPLAVWVAFGFSSAAAQNRAEPAVKQWRVVSSEPKPTATTPALPTAEPMVDPAVVRAAFNADPHDMAVADQVFTESRSGGDCDHCGGCDRCEILDRSHGSFPGAWLTGEYLQWSVSAADLPPLLRATPGASPAQTGLQSVPGQTLFGPGVGDMSLSGFRIAGGFWTDASETTAVEFSYSGLPEASDRFLFDSSQFPTMGRPYFDRDGANAGFIVAHPDISDGQIAFTNTTEMHLVDAFRRDLVFENHHRQIDTLIGLRYASLSESLLIEQTSGNLAFAAPGSSKSLFDRFDTGNQFLGMTLGFACREQLGLLNLDLRGTVGLGRTSSEVRIAGETTNTVPDPSGTPVSASFPGGLLAQPTNIGVHSRDRFTVMPELYAGISTRLTPNWEISAGYRLLYWNRVAQPGDQIDRSVSQLPPDPPVAPFSPGARMDSGSVLIQGLQTGLTCHF